jgi:hypothetical protein
MKRSFCIQGSLGAAAALFGLLRAAETTRGTTARSLRNARTVRSHPAWIELVFAGIAALWAGLSAAAAEPEFQPLFNGKDLDGWDGQPGMWRVKDGCIEGGPAEGGPVERSNWLIRQQDGKDAIFKDFHFKAEFCWVVPGNSGVQYRSTRLHPKHYGVGGYQFEVRPGVSSGTGYLYHQSHSGPNAPLGTSVINEGGKGVLQGEMLDASWLRKQEPLREPPEWIRCDIVCRGNHMAHFVNGYPTIEFIDRDEKTADRKRRNDDGVIALQIHGGPPFRILYRNLYLKQYPDSFADAIRVFNDENLDGWQTPGGAPDCWTASPLERDPKRGLRRFGFLACKGTAKQSLVLAAEHGPDFVFRCQVKGGAWKPAANAPFREVAGWNLLEAVVRGGAARVELNGEPRGDLPPLVAGGKVALPSDVAAEYRNLVLIPIVAARGGS